MRVLLTSNASYAPPRGGSTRSNLVWLRDLARNGNQVRIVSTAWKEATQTVVDGIAIRSIKDLPLHTSLLAEEIRAFDPDFVLVSSEDLSHRLLREASRNARIVYLAHTPQFFSFGPESWNPEPEATELVRNADAVVVIGHHMAGYIERHLGRRATVIHPPIYGVAPFPRFGRFGSGGVLMINPCAVKGVSVFLALAERFPHLPFCGLTGWGTTADDRSRMEQVANVRILDSVPRIDDVLKNASVVLMPSVWYEGFGLIAMEAMLRGVPVIASNSGGLEEAKAGTEFVIPVKLIDRYLPQFDEVHMPIPVVPEQDLDSWVAALHTLTTENVAYEREAEHSRTRGLEFVSKLDAGDLGKLLHSLPRKRHLTSQQKALLIAKLRARI